MTFTSLMLASEAIAASSMGTVTSDIEAIVPESSRVVSSSVQSNLFHERVSHSPPERFSVSVDVRVDTSIDDMERDGTIDVSELSNVSTDMLGIESSGNSGGDVCQLDLSQTPRFHESLSNTTSSVDCMVFVDIEAMLVLTDISPNSISSVLVSTDAGLRSGYSGGLVCHVDCSHDCMSHMSLSNVSVSTLEMLERLPLAIEPASVTDIESSTSVSARDNEGTTYGVFGGEGCHSNESYSSSFQMPPSNIYITHPHPRYP